MSAIDELRATMVRLRAECPWDREQTHQSLARCLIDETSELLETIDQEDLPHMREELGDVLIQVIFHALLAEEAGHFNFDDVARDINAKLVRRHPHVFGPQRLDTSDQVVVQWDQIKATEPGRAVPSGLFKELPPRLPALMFAEAIWKQIQKKRLPADGAVDVARIQALAPQLTDAALGRMLFELAAAARAQGLDPEGALRRHADGVRQAVEQRASAPGAA
jgi:XTP/dITP diphosphohydrolase/tetrapyrrole methylase family protein/MazG family protein